MMGYCWKMMEDPKLFARFKMLMKQANAGGAGTPPSPREQEALISAESLGIS